MKYFNTMKTIPPKMTGTVDMKKKMQQMQGKSKMGMMGAIQRRLAKNK